MTRFLNASVVLGLLLYTGSAAAQATAWATAPELPFESETDFYRMPVGTYFGEGIGVSTNSKGHVFIMTRSKISRVFEFDQNGNFVKEFGKGSYAFNFAHSVRVDAEDNVWAVDEGTNLIVKFSPEGKVLMVIGKRPDPLYQITSMPGTAGYIGSDRPYSFHRPTDIAFDPQGNFFISDGYTDSRVVKYDKNGVFIRSVGTRGSGINQFSTPHTIAADAQGNVYVGDRGNGRIVVLDNDLNWKAEYDHVGNPWGICISEGPTQYLFTTNSAGTGVDLPSKDIVGEIYKMELDGTVIGKFGGSGMALREFGSAHQISCKDPDVVYVTEITAWRVQKILLGPNRMTTQLD